MFLKLLLFFILLGGAACAKDIQPLFRLTSSGLVSDIVVDGPLLYAGNDRGSVEVFDLASRKKVSEILIEPITDFMGDAVAPKIFSVDRLNGKTLFVSQASAGYSNVWIHDGKHLKQVIDEKQKLSIIEARFADEKRIVLGTLGYEMILYETDERLEVYRTHVAQGAFSDMAMSEDRTKMVAVDESGGVTLLNVEDSKVLQLFDSENVDNVYRIDLRNGMLITAGKDRRVGVYPPNAAPYHIQSDFLVYCAALSPSARMGVYSSGIDNDLQLFDTATRQKSHRLVGHNGTLNAIVFINEDELVSAAEERDILVWKID